VSLDVAWDLFFRKTGRSSRRNIHVPKSAFPNTAFSDEQTPAATCATTDLLPSSSDRRDTRSGDSIQGCAHDPCRRVPSRSEHPERDTSAGLAPRPDEQPPLSARGTGISSPIQMILDFVDCMRTAPVSTHLFSGEARPSWKASLPRR
jgi:hypothetical protein